MAAPRVLVVDDEASLRMTLAANLELEGFEVVEASNAEQALHVLQEQHIDLVLSDIRMPGMNGVECVRQLKAALPQLQVLMLTVYEDSDSLFNSFKAGASGYLLKRTASARLLEAIHEVNTGGSPMTPQLARRMVQYFSAPPAAKEDPEMARLTPGEKEFLDQLANGYAYKEIADRMKISIDTVRSYVRTVYEKLHVHSRTEAVVKYLRR